MNFAEPQSIVETFAVYPREEKLGALSSLAAGLNGEAGEVAETFFVISFDSESKRNELIIRDKMLSEISVWLEYFHINNQKAELSLTGRRSQNINNSV